MLWNFVQRLPMKKSLKQKSWPKDRSTKSYLGVFEIRGHLDAYFCIFVTLPEVRRIRPPHGKKRNEPVPVQ